jgi:two-component system, NtrC family, nitrogen regulation sensor histidine kinase GlnL
LPDLKPPGPAEFLTAMQTAVLSIGPDGRIDQINPATEALLNISAAHLKGRMLADILTLPTGFDVSGEGPFAAYEVNAQTSRGTRLLIDIEVAHLPDHVGWRLVTIHGSAMSHRVGHRLERVGGARAAIGVAAMLAHEIKNPLSGIRGAAQLVEARLGEDDKRMTRLIRTEVDRVAALVDQMEGFTDTRPADLAPENIHQIIDHARNVAKSGFGATLRIIDAYDPSLPPVLAHRDSLIQILLNLLKNAAETAEEGGQRTVRITTAYRQGVSVLHERSGRKQALPIELCVIDDGPGVPADLAEDLFEPFVTTKKSGRGLGLALADKLVRDMGGVIQYAREGGPPETVFRILLARAEQSSS